MNNSTHNSSCSLLTNVLLVDLLIEWEKILGDTYFSNSIQVN